MLKAETMALRVMGLLLSQSIYALHSRNKDKTKMKIVVTTGERVLVASWKNGL